MTKTTTTLRCAIYTRKSSEEGLDQAFNSLDAQREACEAFIQSQRHEGWRLLADGYDDGGFSGGTIERPALKRLLAGIDAGAIDVVVVYKVDRLTRSLSDFARIIEVFDRQNVSFVSVTQQFNTTTSMGRLTLNVLLSFAQFEREVTGERIRDKFLASRRKGMWMGGHPPLGYDLKDRKLHVNKREAALVRRIFADYGKNGCVRSLKRRLDAEGALSKRRISNAGITYGGHPFTTGALYKILTNRAYLGEAVHKGTSYPGEHAAIIDTGLWGRVQDRRDRNRTKRRNGANATNPSLPVGLLYDAAGRRLTPSHATKGPRRYRYYVTPREFLPAEPGNPQAWRIPAHDIEDLIKAEVIALLLSPTRLDHVLPPDALSARQRVSFYQAACAYGDALRQASPAPFRQFLLCFAQRITVRSDSVDLEIDPGRFIAAIRQKEATPAAPISDAEDKTNDQAHVVRIGARLRRCGRETRLVLLDDNCDERPRTSSPGLIKAVVKAHIWLRQILDGKATSIAEIARREGTSRPHASQILNLAFLAPDIIEAILDGRHPPELNVSLMTKKHAVPLAWQDQRRAFGLF